jgi:hypothetical protein
MFHGPGESLSGHGSKNLYTEDTFRKVPEPNGPRLKILCTRRKRKSGVPENVRKETGD